MTFSFVQHYDGWAHVLRVRAIRCAPLPPPLSLSRLCGIVHLACCTPVLTLSMC